MRHTIRIACLASALALLPLAAHAQAARGTRKAAATTICNDGTTSASTGAGTCSGHGGIRAGVTCKDGTLSQSSGPGTCSGHGGIKEAKLAKAEKREKAEKRDRDEKGEKGEKGERAERREKAAKPSFTAKCKDGTTSTSKTRQGACAGHGGVAQWMSGT